MTSSSHSLCVQITEKLQLTPGARICAGVAGEAGGRDLPWARITEAVTGRVLQTAPSHEHVDGGGGLPWGHECACVLQPRCESPGDVDDVLEAGAYLPGTDVAFGGMAADADRLGHVILQGDSHPLRYCQGACSQQHQGDHHNSD